MAIECLKTVETDSPIEESPFSNLVVLLLSQNWQQRHRFSRLLAPYFKRVELTLDVPDTLDRFADSDDSPEIVLVDMVLTEKEINAWNEAMAEYTVHPKVLGVAEHIEDALMEMTMGLGVVGTLPANGSPEDTLKELAAAIGLAGVFSEFKFESKESFDKDSFLGSPELVAKGKTYIAPEDGSAALVSESEAGQDHEIVVTGNPTLDKIARELEIPSPPPLAKLIQEGLLGENARVTEVANALDQDFKLCDHILRVANAPAYGLKSQVKSISHAINVLGAQSFAGLALAMILKNTISLKTARVKAFAGKFWKFSLGNAICCMGMSGLVESFWMDFTPGDAFLLGVSHNSGMLLMAKALEEYEKELNNCWREDPTGRHQCDYEQQVFEYDHALASFALMRAWNLAPALHDAVLHHHDLGDGMEFPDNHTMPLIHMLVLSNHVCNKNLFPNYQANAMSDVIGPILEEYKWKTTRLQRLKSQVDSHLLGQFQALLR